MSIRFSLPIVSKSLFIFILGIAYGLWLGLNFSGVEAQEDAALANQDIAEEIIAYGNAAEFKFCGKMISRPVFLEVKAPKDVCSNSNNYAAERKTTWRMKVLLTAYSSTAAQTDSTPFITANGTYVYDGIVANNGLPFGTELRIPELFGDKIFSVQDRMHWRKGSYQFDIWFPTYEQAKNFGVKYAYVEVLKK